MFDHVLINIRAEQRKSSGVKTVGLRGEKLVSPYGCGPLLGGFASLVGLLQVVRSFEFDDDTGKVLESGSTSKKWSTYAFN